MTNDFDTQTEKNRKQKEHDEAVKRGEKWAQKVENSFSLKLLFVCTLGILWGIIMHFIL